MFRDKVILITGGGGGIGSAVARRFGRAGAKIALVDLHDDAVQDRLAELERDGIEAVGMACDITDPEACVRATSDAIERV
ncbi:MAG: SDR family NAD(P)-dependent oxidoreductase, partial [Candidatus Hydrogenedentes bacterium]|nr:SDR family NAD(P)-dependent oxidoreductase [Candidatus Hydrogenedentota bacterium]